MELSPLGGLLAKRIINVNRLGEGNEVGEKKKNV